MAIVVDAQSSEVEGWSQGLAGLHDTRLGLPASLTDPWPVLITGLVEDPTWWAYRLLLDLLHGFAATKE